MESPNNLAGSPVEPAPQAIPATSGLWRHYWRHLWLGSILWIGLGITILFFNIYKFIIEYYYPSILSSDYLLFSVLVLIPSVLAAAVGGLLRQPLLARIIRRARSRRALVWGSLAGFELSVLLVAIGYWCLSGEATTSKAWEHLTNSLLRCFLMSLPWLLSTAWASWRLAQARHLP